MSSFSPGSAPGLAAGPASPGTAGCGPVPRDSSQGGLDAGPGRGEATCVIGVVGPAGPPGPGPAPGAARAPDGPGVPGRVHPGNGAGWSGYDGGPLPGKGVDPIPGNGGAPGPEGPEAPDAGPG